MRLAFLTPAPDPAGGGSTFNAGLVAALREQGHEISLHHGAEDLPAGARPVIDGLLLPDLEPALDRLAAADAVVIVHHVAAKAGRDPETRDTVRASERRLLPRFRRVIATSAPVAERLAADYGVTAQVLQPGLPDLPRSQGSGGPGCRILSVGVLTPRKGHDHLLRAVARLPDLDYTLTIAGDAQRDPVHAGALVGLIDDLALGSRVTLLPDPGHDALEQKWRQADLFALHTRWEGWPAGIAESLRRGIPAIATAAGGVGALLPQAAGMPVKPPAEPDDAPTFSKCLRRAIFDRALRQSMAEGAWQVGQNLPGWPQQALAFLAIVKD